MITTEEMEQYVNGHARRDTLAWEPNECVYLCRGCGAKFYDPDKNDPAGLVKAFDFLTKHEACRGEHT